MTLAEIQGNTNLDDYINNIGEMLIKQEKEWRRLVDEIMSELNIEYYPTRKDFAKLGCIDLYDKIRNYMGHDLLSEQMNLITKEEYNLREAVFDLMLRLEVNYYPSELQFYEARRVTLYKKIGDELDHEDLRKRMKLLIEKEYIKLTNKQ